MRERLIEWSEWAERKLAGTDMEILVAPGNDDPYFLDDVLRDLPRFRLVEEQVVDDAIPDLDVEILSTGISNPTPWKTHREVPEEELRRRLDDLAGRVRNCERAIFNIHVPPYASQLDEGPIIDSETLKQSTGFGQDATIPVGSTAVREAIEEYQPMISLHGHIHESRGIAHIGRTLAVNPGSDYSDGVLRGAFIELTAAGTTSYQLTSG
jgi:Icc-related predicted phosphoesterase